AVRGIQALDQFLVCQPMKKDYGMIDRDRPAESLSHRALPKACWAFLWPGQRYIRSRINSVSFRAEELRPRGGSGAAHEPERYQRQHSDLPSKERSLSVGVNWK